MESYTEKMYIKKQGPLYFLIEFLNATILISALLIAGCTTAKTPYRIITAVIEKDNQVLVASVSRMYSSSEIRIFDKKKNAWEGNIPIPDSDSIKAYVFDKKILFESIKAGEEEYCIKKTGYNQRESIMLLQSSLSMQGKNNEEVAKLKQKLSESSQKEKAYRDCKNTQSSKLFILTEDNKLNYLGTLNDQGISAIDNESIYVDQWLRGDSNHNLIGLRYDWKLNKLADCHFDYNKNLFIHHILKNKESNWYLCSLESPPLSQCRADGKMLIIDTCFNGPLFLLEKKQNNHFEGIPLSYEFTEGRLAGNGKGLWIMGQQNGPISYQSRSNPIFEALRDRLSANPEQIKSSNINILLSKGRLVLPYNVSPDLNSNLQGIVMIEDRSKSKISYTYHSINFNQLKDQTLDLPDEELNMRCGIYSGAFSSGLIDSNGILWLPAYRNQSTYLLKISNDDCQMIRLNPSIGEYLISTAKEIAGSVGFIVYIIVVGIFGGSQ